jgi:ATP-dependent Lon protease
MLNREHEVLTLSSKIQTEVATSISKTQRDFFLREQMRAIQRELGESDPNASEIRGLREKIEETPMPAEAKQVATQELDRLQQMPPAAAEYAVRAINLIGSSACPGRKRPRTRLDLDEPSDPERAAFRPDECQGSASEFLAVIKRRKEIKGPIPLPRRGRRVSERLAWSAACDALDGNSRESPWRACAIEGRDPRTSPHYVGACRAASIQTLARGREPRPGHLLDELDKVGADFRGTRLRLAQVLDPAQNSYVYRHLPRSAIDLSRVLFVTTRQLA